MTARRGIRLAALGAIALAALALLAVVVLGDGDDRRTVRAELDTVRGLIERNFVRVNGVNAGTVDEIELTDRGTALVTMKVERWVPAPRRDATAVVRPADLFGDVFIAYAPGDADRPLEGRIARARTANVARLDDLLRVFQAPARAGLRAMLVELGVALERQGGRLNEQLVALRPALRAAGDVMGELGSERASLRTLIADSERTAAQASGRTRSIEGMVASFGALLEETAAHDRPLERGIEGLPSTLVRLRSTTDELTRAAAETTPLARRLGDAAPGLSTALRRLDPFLRRTDTVAATARPTLRRTTRFLRDGHASFRELGGGLGALAKASPELHGLAGTLAAAAPQLGESLLTATAAQAVEPGNQWLDPTTNPLRRYWRGAAVLSCETFGRPVRPGCLAELLAEDDGGAAGARQAAARKRAADRPQATTRGRTPQATAPAGERDAGSPTAGTPGPSGTPTSPARGEPAPNATPKQPAGRTPTPSPARSLLDLLFKP